MPRTKKIRGHKRRWKDIDRWISIHKNLDIEYLMDYERDYAKIRVHPWSGISLTDSKIPEPTGETKNRILQGLIDIYEGWKDILDKTNKTYYLKIWLFEPQFSKSQVVCALGDSIEYYENLFYKPFNEKQFNSENYGRLSSQLSEFKWEFRLDEDHIYSSEFGSPEEYECQAEYEEDKKWFDQIMKKPHRTTEVEDSSGEPIEIYSFQKEDVWLGQKSKVVI